MPDMFATAATIINNLDADEEKNKRALALLTRLNALDIAEMLGLK
jgi:hypothetical protein